MVEGTSLVLTAVATFFAAIAAWFSYSVSRSSLKFQKSYAMNQSLIRDLTSLSAKARTLRTYISNPGELSDNQFESMEPLLQDIRSEMQRLGYVGVLDFNSLKISRITRFGEMVDQISKGNDYLSEAIEAIESKLDDIFK